MRRLLTTVALICALAPAASAQYQVSDSRTHALLESMDGKLNNILRLLRDIRANTRQMADVIGDPTDTGYVDVSAWTEKLAGFKRIQTGEQAGMYPDQYLKWLKQTFYAQTKFPTQEEQNQLTERRKRHLNREQLSSYAVAQYAQQLLADAQQETAQLVNEANKNLTMVKDQKMQTKLRILDLVKGEIERQMSIAEMRLNGARAIALDPVLWIEGTNN